MQKFEKLNGLVAPMDRPNVDTDSIIPKQYLKSIKRTGFGPCLFDAWRYLDRGEPGMDHSKRRLNPDFVLNQPRYQGAQILLARDNFGCGSSREHAPWALLDFGIKAVISTEFADIFRSNSLKNGLLPILVQPELHERLMQNPGDPVRIDLATTTLTLADVSTATFPIDAFARYCLMEGTDQFGFLQNHLGDIIRFEEHRPWTP